ncbi:NTP transferase domain-containing protein [Cryptosporangium sp. NPDC051539]|uniref:NTP transferase domain-containing protein n=1 Tax=Cryptosporangium sp. NPDC051539 TaxID=3363962 RepID=UPI0037A72A44
MSALFTTAIVPAAGRGTRLGLAEGPKLLAPVTRHETIWTILRRTLAGLVDQAHVVVAPSHLDAVRAATDGNAPPTTFAVQPAPTGMGDAVFEGWADWQHANVVVVIWGDQVNVSRDTIAHALRVHGGRPRRVVLPLVRLAEPYVEYRFNRSGRLTHVLQAREGDRCRPGGWSDVGTFVLSTPELVEEWQRYRADSALGSRTGEVNFLPFLGRLAARGWDVRPSSVSDPREARGINTADDLEFFRSLYRPTPSA